MKYFKAWLLTTVSYFVIDFVMRAFLLGPLTQSDSAGIVRAMTEVNMQVLMLEYLLMPLVLIYLAIQTQASKQPLSYSFKLGSVIGLAVFGMYEIVNSALLPQWVSPATSLVNVLGGVIIVALSAVVAGWSLKKFNSK